MGYRRLINRPVLTWMFVAVASKLPVAMAPLVFVFLMGRRRGGYPVGAALAAAYVVGEVIGAALLGPRLTATRARTPLMTGLAAGTGTFTALGLLPPAHPLVLGVFAVLADAAPSAAPGGLRTLLTTQVPDDLVVKALSAESVLTNVVWAVSPALAGVLALGVAAPVSLLVGALLMAAATVALRAQPPGWTAKDDDRLGTSMARTLVRAWPIYLTASAAMSLLAMAELVLPALPEQRGIGVAWAGPLLAGFATAAAIGAALYGVRAYWPGSLRAQSLVLLLGVAGCMAVIAMTPSLPIIAAALVVAGLMQSGVQVTRALSLRAALVGVVQTGAQPSVALLAGVGLTMLLTAASAIGEIRTPVPACANS